MCFIVVCHGANRGRSVDVWLRFRQWYLPHRAGHQRQHRLDGHLQQTHALVWHGARGGLPRQPGLHLHGGHRCTNQRRSKVSTACSNSNCGNCVKRYVSGHGSSIGKWIWCGTGQHTWLTGGSDTSWPCPWANVLLVHSYLLQFVIFQTRTLKAVLKPYSYSSIYIYIFCTIVGLPCLNWQPAPCRVRAWSFIITCTVMTWAPSECTRARAQTKMAQQSGLHALVTKATNGMLLPLISRLSLQHGWVICYFNRLYLHTKRLILR